MRSDVHQHIYTHRDVSDEDSSSSCSEKPSAHGLHVDDYVEPLIPVVHKNWDDRAFTRVKLICSYGGRILLRPHDNQLRYVGGDTHVVVVSRNVTLSELTAKLSKTFGAQSAAVLVKYQLPCHDLDTLISVVSEDDLENMMEEHDRLEVSSGSRARLRLFLFPSRLERSYTAGISDHHSRERWFVDALNDNCSYLTPPLARVQSEIPSIISEAAPDLLTFGTNMDAVQEWAAVESHNDSTALEQTSFEKVVDSGTGAMPSTTLFGSLLQLHHAAAAVGSIDGPSSAPSSPLKRNPMEQPLVDANFSASSSAPPAVISALSAAACAAASKGSRKPGGSYEELGFLSNHQHPTAALPSRFGASASRPLL